MHLLGIGWESVNYSYIHQCEDRDQRRGVVNTITKLWFPYSAESILTSWETISFLTVVESEPLTVTLSSLCPFVSWPSLSVGRLLSIQNIRNRCWYPGRRLIQRPVDNFNPLKPELNPIFYLLALLGAHHFLHVSRIRVKLLTCRRLMSYIYIWSTHSWCF